MSFAISTQSFEESRVHSVCIHGPSQEQSTVVSGVVVKTTSSQMSLIQQHDAENGHVIMVSYCIHQTSAVLAGGYVFF